MDDRERLRFERRMSLAFHRGVEPPIKRLRASRPRSRAGGKRVVAEPSRPPTPTTAPANALIYDAQRI